MRGRSKGLVVLAAGVPILALAVYFLIRDPAPTLSAEPSNSVTRNKAAKADGLPLLEAEARAPGAGDRDSAESREALPAIGQVEEHPEAAAKEASRDGSGRIVISAIDAQTREPVDRVHVRAASGTRLADRQAERGKPSLKLTLTPDTYSLLVSSYGYEATELPPVQVSAGETITLDPVVLSPGSARIVGMVRGTEWSQGVLRVKLLGEGRRPCPKCQFGANPELPGSSSPSLAWVRATPCPTCGYAGRYSLSTVERSGSFTFQNLASGPYLLRLVDVDRFGTEKNWMLGVSKAVDLHPAESLPVELEFVASRSVCVEIIDTDGMSLAGEWATRLRGRPSAKSESEDNSALGFALGEPPEFQCALRVGDSRLARSSFSPPTPPERSGMRPSPFGSRRLSSFAKTKTTDDQPRLNAEPLRPEPRAPSVDASNLSAHVDEEGFVCIDGVPSLALTLDMQCESFVATVEIPMSREATRVRVHLTNKMKTPPPAGTEATNPTITFREFEASLWH